MVIWSGITHGLLLGLAPPPPVPLPEAPEPEPPPLDDDARLMADDIANPLPLASIPNNPANGELGPDEIGGLPLLVSGDKPRREPDESATGVSGDGITGRRASDDWRPLFSTVSQTLPIPNLAVLDSDEPGGGGTAAIEGNGAELPPDWGSAC